jgi:hypothetical protein
MPCAAAAVLSSAFAVPAAAVRVNPDGHGQALIYPCCTIGSTANGNAFVTALAVTNNDETHNPTSPRGRIGQHARAGATTVVDTATGAVQPGTAVTYDGLPIVGFAVQSYGSFGLSGSPNVLSNYGGRMSHRFQRRIEVASP